jgi:hypothetical protein
MMSFQYANYLPGLPGNDGRLIRAVYSPLLSALSAHFLVPLDPVLLTSPFYL